MIHSLSFEIRISSGIIKILPEKAPEAGKAAQYAVK